jgi:dTDP-4-amino-4,6-dideoxygalactose transaminase
LNNPIYVGSPNLGCRQSFLQHVNDCLDRRWLTNDGPLVRLFEERVRQISGADHAIAVCNATCGLMLAAKALDLQGEVIMPSFTFVASAHALQWQGLRPVFADIDPHTHNIDPACIAGLITPNTSGILGVHLWGRPCDTAAIQAIARRHSLKVMYDAAHAFGCSAGHTPIGSFGDCEVFSFHATKFINSIEGGVITTNNIHIAERLRLLRNFGFRGYDNVVGPGINAKMNEVCAAMGLANLDAIADIVAINRRNYDAYTAALTGISGVTLIQYDARNSNNFQYIVLEVDRFLPPFTRDRLVSALHDQNIIARRYFWPGCHKMEPYRTHLGGAAPTLKHTEGLSDRILTLPTGQLVSPDIIMRICAIIKRTLDHLKAQ